MTTPAFLFSLALASIAAALYHLLFGRSLRQLAFFWVASICGFAIGQIVGNALEWRLPTIGRIRPVEGLTTSIMLMTVVRAIRV